MIAIIMALSSVYLSKLLAVLWKNYLSCTLIWDTMKKFVLSIEMQCIGNLSSCSNIIQNLLNHIQICLVYCINMFLQSVKTYFVDYRIVFTFFTNLFPKIVFTFEFFILSYHVNNILVCMTSQVCRFTLEVQAVKSQSKYRRNTNSSNYWLIDFIFQKFNSLLPKF